MKKNVTIKDVIGVEKALDSLLEHHICLNINTVVKLLKLKKEVNGITDYVVRRTMELIPNLEHTTELSEEENMIYNAIYHDVVEVDNYDLTFDDLQTDNIFEEDLSKMKYLVSVL